MYHAFVYCTKLCCIVLQFVLLIVCHLLVLWNKFYIFIIATYVFIGTTFFTVIYFHIKWTQELESQAINVLHPRNRKFPPTQLLAETHNPMTLGNEIPSKNTNASRHHGATTNERQLAQESENHHLIQNSNRNDEIQKQA